ncbi:GNAT family N-acetyltransferase [Aliiroseovarius sp. 2305UL8-7]|uniref:GNAT family N-acetyltransferase n=1 Tax=Aliiroseovarius conchicola TaxID=3121637 RepID=UPI003526C91A
MIRKAEEGDAAAIQSLWNHAIRDTLITFNATEKTLSDVKAALGEYDAFLVVEQGGKILGFAGLFPFRSGVGLCAHQRALDHVVG